MKFLIDRDGNVFVGQQIPELHHALSLPRQLAPAAGFFGILFDGLVFATARHESHGAEALAASAYDFMTPAFNHDLGAPINCSATARKAVRSNIFPTLGLNTESWLRSWTLPRNLALLCQNSASLYPTMTDVVPVN
jgi:hypothetical protein